MNFNKKFERLFLAWKESYVTHHWTCARTQLVAYASADQASTGGLACFPCGCFCVLRRNFLSRGAMSVNLETRPFFAYNGLDMHPRIRLLLFLVFLFAFLITAPLVALYTAGYRFDFAANAIVHTGVLNVTSAPRSATVWIDGEKQSDRTPSVLDDVMPGERVVKVTKEGYTSWEKTLLVESRDTTFVYDAMLYLETEFEVEDEREILVSSLSPDDHTLAYLTSEGSWAELWLITESEKQLLTRISDFENASYVLSWSSEGNYVALEQAHDGELSLAIVDTRNGSTIETHEVLQTAEDYWWDAGNDDALLIRYDGNVYKLSITDKSLAEIVPENPQRTVTRDGVIELVKSTDRVVLARVENEIASIITYLPYGNYQFLPAPEDVVMLEDVERERLILIDLGETDQPILINKELSVWQWHENGDLLLFSDGFDIEIYTRSSHTTQTLTRLSEQITDLLWYPLGNTIMYATEHQVIAFELESRDGHSAVALYEGDVQSAWVDEAGEFLYLMGSEAVQSRRLQR